QRALRSGEGSVQQGRLQARHDEGAPARGGPAAAVVGRHPGMEGEVAAAKCRFGVLAVWMYIRTTICLVAWPRGIPPTGIRGAGCTARSCTTSAARSSAARYSR